MADQSGTYTPVHGSAGTDWTGQAPRLPAGARLASSSSVRNNGHARSHSITSPESDPLRSSSAFAVPHDSVSPTEGYFATASIAGGRGESSGSSPSTSSHGHHAVPAQGQSVGTSSSGSRPRTLSEDEAIVPQHIRQSLFLALDNVGMETESSTLARGDIGSAYSRYSVSSPPSTTYPRLSSYAVTPVGHTPLSGSSDDGEIAIEQMPVTDYTPRFPGDYQQPVRFSQYSEYSTGTGRASTLLERADTPYSVSDSKYMEDAALLWNAKNTEEDDFLHDPRTLLVGKSDRFWRFPTSLRGLSNACGIALLLGGFIALFLGWPVHTYLLNDVPSTGFGFSLGGINRTGQVPDIPNLPSLIDRDTPAEIRNGIRTGFNGRKYQLAFSDEFNRDGRTFYPGDDPFWEAVDLNYWQTRNMEWYDPDAATTKDGKLLITLSEQPNHGLNFRSAMLQSWNKLCFNGGMYVEVSISLPGDTKASGFWPGAWSMGNLGRAGYGATNDGMWPYSYSSCDVGTLPGQMFANNTPVASFNGSGQPDYRGRLSILGGQRASACTCPGQPHPGPNVNVGRGAPEIDIIEAQVDWRGYGTASQSIQLAPFDYQWQWNNRTSDGMVIYNKSATYLNEWKGAATQESCSAVTNIGSTAYDGAGYQSYGYEFVPGTSSDSQITWAFNGKPTWTLKAGAFKPDARTGVSQRTISEEPMYLILNLGMSAAFQTLQFNRLKFPGVMRIDYVRVWQEQGKVDVTCDPPSHPTSNYINTYNEYYSNANTTTWPRTLWPKNRLTGC